MDLTGDQIKRLREARGLTQEQLAEALGVGPKTIGNWERRRTGPKNRMGMLRQFFQVDDPDPADPLRALSDVELLAELMRRAIARDSRRRGNDETG